MIKRIPRSSLMLAIMLALLALAAPILPPYPLSFLTEVFVWCLLSLSFDVLFGYVGLLSFGQAMFFGVGSYGVVLSVMHLSASVVTAILVAITVSFMFAWLTGLVATRLSGHYFTIMTFVISLVLFSLADSWKPVTGGNDGITVDAPQYLFLGVSTSLPKPLADFYLVLILGGAAFWLCWKLVRSEEGLIYQAIRGNSGLAESVGHNVARYKLHAFTVAGTVAGLSGALYALSYRYASSDFFHWLLSGEAAVWTILGGKGTLVGPVLGTGVFFSLKDQFSSWLGSRAAFYPILLGAVLLLAMRFAPNGIISLIRDKFVKVKHISLLPITWQPTHDGWSRVEPILEVRALRKAYGGVAALHEVSLTLGFDEQSSGQRALDSVSLSTAPTAIVVIVVGSNAAGKTTLLNIISGHVKHDAGEVYFRNTIRRVSNKVSPYKVSLAGIGRTFQQVNLFQELSVYDNVRVAALSRRSRLTTFLDCGLDQAIHDKVTGLLTAVGLLDQAWKQAGTLSHGQQRVLQIAIALATDPVLLLLDEPTAGVSAGEAEQVIDLLHRVSQHISMLIVEHDVGVVRNLGFTTYVLKDGAVIAHGPTEEVLSSPQVINSFLGE